MFHASALARASVAPVSLWRVIGLSDCFSLSVSCGGATSLKTAPSNARVAGGYLIASVLSFAAALLDQVLESFAALPMSASGVFLMQRMVSRICNSGIVSFVIVFFA